MTTRKTAAARNAAKVGDAQRKAQLATVFAAARSSSGSLIKLAEMVRPLIGTAWDAAGKATASANEVRSVYLAGYVAGYLPNLHNATPAAAQKAAAAIIAKPGPTAAKTKADARQTEEEAKACAAGRQAWGRLLKAAGLEPVNKRTGKRKGKGKGKSTAPQGGAAPATIELAKVAAFIPPQGKAANDKGAAVQWFRDNAAMAALQVERLNQAVFKAHKETLPLGLAEAVKAYKEAMDKIASAL